MSNLSQTASLVAIDSVSARSEPVVAGEAITQGMPVYQATDSTWYQSDANVVAASAASHGIALSPASGSGKAFNVLRLNGQDVNVGATLAVGEIYVVSATKGAICPYADLVTSDYVIILGVAKSTSLMRTLFNATGIQKA